MQMPDSDSPTQRNSEQHENRGNLSAPSSDKGSGGGVTGAGKGRPGLGRRASEQLMRTSDLFMATGRMHADLHREYYSRSLMTAMSELHFKLFWFIKGLLFELFPGVLFSGWLCLALEGSVAVRNRVLLPLPSVVRSPRLFIFFLNETVAWMVFLTFTLFLAFPDQMTQDHVHMYEVLCAGILWMMRAFVIGFRYAYTSLESLQGRYGIRVASEEEFVKRAYPFLMANWGTGTHSPAFLGVILHQLFASQMRADVNLAKCSFTVGAEIAASIWKQVGDKVKDAAVNYPGSISDGQLARKEAMGTFSHIEKEVAAGRLPAGVLAFKAALDNYRGSPSETRLVMRGALAFGVIGLVIQLIVRAIYGYPVIGTTSPTIALRVCSLLSTLFTGRLMAVFLLTMLMDFRRRYAMAKWFTGLLRHGVPIACDTLTSEEEWHLQYISELTSEVEAANIDNPAMSNIAVNHHFSSESNTTEEDKRRASTETATSISSWNTHTSNTASPRPTRNVSQLSVNVPLPSPSFSLGSSSTSLPPPSASGDSPYCELVHRPNPKKKMDTYGETKNLMIIDLREPENLMSWVLCRRTMITEFGKNLMSRANFLFILSFGTLAGLLGIIAISLLTVGNDDVLGLENTLNSVLNTYSIQTPSAGTNSSAPSTSSVKTVGIRSAQDTTATVIFYQLMCMLIILMITLYAVMTNNEMDNVKHILTQERLAAKVYLTTAVGGGVERRGGRGNSPGRKNSTTGISTKRKKVTQTSSKLYCLSGLLSGSKHVVTNKNDMILLMWVKADFRLLSVLTTVFTTLLSMLFSAMAKK